MPLQGLAPVELPLNEGLVEGLDLRQPAYWLRCPFCGADVVAGQTHHGWQLRHGIPTCETYTKEPREYGKRAISAGAHWQKVTVRYAEDHGGTSRP